MKEKLYPILAALSILLSQNPDHLLLSRIVTQPNSAESISIINPTSSDINLNNYYLSDDEEYYKMQTEGDLSPSHIANGFTARFPDINISAGDTLHLVFNENYTDFYGITFTPNLYLFGTETNSMRETEPGSFGGSANKINDDVEMIILFYWDGNASNPVKDVDYFLWGNEQNAVDKSGIIGYLDDTAPENQKYFENDAKIYYSFSRVNSYETEESATGGNGITGHNETSENFRITWAISELPGLGCTDPLAPNFDPTAKIDNGLCALNFEDIINNCLSDTIICDGQYELLNPTQCPLYNQRVILEGVIIDFYDITPNDGPFSFKIEDDNGYRISFVVWPKNSTYQDGFDITLTELYKLTKPPFNKYIVQISGKLDVYCRSGSELDKYGDWQVVVEYESDISIIKEIDIGGFFIEEENSLTKIDPVPFVFIPSIGETLDYKYSHPSNSRVIIRIFDLSGRFITSLIDKYFHFSGTWHNGINPNTKENSNSSAWNGRDHLGQIVAPGTYIMHIETQNPQTGETQTDAAPIVIGVPN